MLKKKKLITVEVDGRAPTSEEIAAECARLEKQMIRGKRQFAAIAGLVAVGFCTQVAVVSPGGYGVGFALVSAVGLGLVFALRGALVGGVAGVVAAAFLVARMEAGEGPGTGVVVVVLAMMGFIAARMESIQQEQARLEIIDQEMCPKVLDWCKTHEAIAKYQSQVAEQGRYLIAAEVSGMQSWVDCIEESTAKAELEKKQQGACEQLKSPTLRLHSGN